MRCAAGSCWDVRWNLAHFWHSSWVQLALQANADSFERSIDQALRLSLRRYVVHLPVEETLRALCSLHFQGHHVDLRFAHLATLGKM